MIRRINLWGGPGVGKSVMAARIYSHFQQQDKNIELCREEVKNWAYEGKRPTGFDQLYLFGTQIRKEERILKNNPSYIVVTDCPIGMIAFYTKYYGEPYWGHLYDITRDYDAKYRPVNILLKREFEYVPRGRLQSFQEAIEIDEEMRESSDYIMEFWPTEVDGLIEALETEFSLWN